MAKCHVLIVCTSYKGKKYMFFCIFSRFFFAVKKKSLKFAANIRFFHS